jgi:hypothetical protein
LPEIFTQAAAAAPAPTLGDLRARELQERMRQLDESEEEAKKRAERVSAALATGLRATMQSIQMEKEKESSQKQQQQQVQQQQQQLQRREAERTPIKGSFALGRASSLPNSAAVPDASMGRPVASAAGVGPALSEVNLAKDDDDDIEVPLRRNSVLWGRPAPTPIDRRASMNFDAPPRTADGLSQPCMPSRRASMNFDALPRRPVDLGAATSSSTMSNTSAVASQSTVTAPAPSRRASMNFDSDIGRPSGFFGPTPLSPPPAAGPQASIAAAPQPACTPIAGTNPVASEGEDTVQVPMRRNSVLWGARAPPPPLDRRASISLADAARRSSIVVGSTAPQEGWSWMSLGSLILAVAYFYFVFCT